MDEVIAKLVPDDVLTKVITLFYVHCKAYLTFC